MGRVVLVGGQHHTRWMEVRTGGNAVQFPKDIHTLNLLTAIMKVAHQSHSLHALSPVLPLKKLHALSQSYLYLSNIFSVHRINIMPLL